MADPKPNGGHWKLGYTGAGAIGLGLTVWTLLSGALEKKADKSTIDVQFKGVEQSIRDVKEQVTVTQQDVREIRRLLEARRGP